MKTFSDESPRPCPVTASWYLTLRRTNVHDSGLPVIKLDWNANIIYANKASFVLIADLSLSMRKKVPAALLRKFPCLSNPEASESIRICSENLATWFYVIGFPEARYIGLYAYEQTKIKIPVLSFGPNKKIVFNDSYCSL